jgi:SagB-type dehydrogenase family enzyme
MKKMKTLYNLSNVIPAGEPESNNMFKIPDQVRYDRRKKQGYAKLTKVVLIVCAVLMMNLRAVSEEKTLTDRAIKLPKPKTAGSVSVEEAINSRRTRRTFDNKPFTLDNLSQVLWAAQGITDERWKHRAAPSAGALFPIDVFIIVRKGGVEKLDAGIYRYIPDGHYLQTKAEGDFNAELRKVGYSQTFFAESPVCLILTAKPVRTTWKYGERGNRYIHFEAGHIAENIQLIGESLGFSVGLVGAFKDDGVASLLKLKKGEIPVYIIPVGYRKAE